MEHEDSVPLPGTVDVSRCERVTAGIGMCPVCGLVKADWIDREAGVKLCEQVKRVFWTLFVAMAGLVLARGVDPVTAQQIVGLIT